MSSAPVLTKCSYCRRSMSSALENCPHCGRLVPTTVQCLLCKENLRSPDSVNRHGECPSDSSNQFFHPLCYNRIAEYCRCPVCGHQLTAEERKQTDEGEFGRTFKCPECGHSSCVATCPECGGYSIVNDDTHELHPACHARGESERIEKWEQHKKTEELRRKGKQCVKCGGKLSFLDVLVGADAHLYCPTFTH